MRLPDTLEKLRQKFFGDIVRTFGWTSLLLLVLLAIAPAKNFFADWHRYQRGYERLIGKRSDAVTLRRHFEPGIQQIWLPETGVVDRCTTCHTALKETTLADITMQPYRPHPAIPHKPEEMGCSICHRGQGTATSVEDAHKSTLAWEEPLLPAKYLESSCGQCHQQDLKGTPQLNLGRQILSQYGCVHCHTIKRPDGSVIIGTDDPPSLAHIADKTTREWIYGWLKDPQAYSTTATMPNFKLRDDEARDISAFLISSSTPASLKVVQASLDEAKKVKDDAALQTKASSLYGESFCASCHAVQNAAGNLVGGDLGPELTKIGNKAKPEWLQAWVRNPHDYDPPTEMPHYRFTDQEVGELTGFLLAKTDADLLANVHLEAATLDQIVHGKRLVNDYGCASCHAINGIKRPENFAPELTKIGSKPVNQLAFAPGVRHTLYDYIGAKIKQPRAFGPSLKMPQYTFNSAQVDALVNALLSHNERALTVPAAKTVPALPASRYEPAGKAAQLINDLNCFSCHMINGRGGDMAPDLTFEGSSVQREWLVQFLRNPNTLRPALIRRMPKFNLTEAEINTLTDYILTVFQSPKVDRDSMPVAGYASGQVELGKQLYYSKYGCQACHIIDTKQDKGYIGPTLTYVGSRLTAAWIYGWIKDPWALRPGTLEPKRNMSDDDARALTAFLMTQKGSEKQEAKKR
ncbi:MAG TPA: c-type cytochrome [Terriglobales bacterium]|nr:c-type cytochrome [Terriglobales bacterium]